MIVVASSDFRILRSQMNFPKNWEFVDKQTLKPLEFQMADIPAVVTIEVQSRPRMLAEPCSTSPDRLRYP